MEQDKSLQQDRSKRFLKAIGLYAIGNLGSKLITFLMVPLYTYFVNPADYGFYDLCLTLILFAVPFMTLQMRDGAFRFLVDNNDENKRKAIVTFAYKVMLTTSLIAIACGLVLSAFAPIRYLWLMLLLLIVMSFYEVVVQITRGLGNTVSFVSAGIISAFGIGIFSILFVVCLNMGIEGIFWANILARVISLFFVELKDKIISRYFVGKPYYGTIKSDIIKYSLPLIPNLVFWWVIGSTDRLFIEHYLGLPVNGVYAVAYRLVSVMHVLSTVFYQAWQETAFLQYESSDRDRFFSGMFNNYLYVFSGMLILFVFVLRANYGWLVSEEFAESVKYLYPMAMSTLLFALVAFMDMGYQCAKDTKRTLPAVILASGVNLVSNYFLVRTIGLWGVVLTSMLTYLVLLIYRIYDMKRYFKLTFYRRSIYPIIMLLVGLVFYYVTESVMSDILMAVVVFWVYVYFAPREVKALVLSKVKNGEN